MTASTNSKFTSGDKSLNKNTTAESRRASKPLMEKRRRARINQSLAVLKSLIVDSQRVEGQKHAKLEKADILEMSVAHLQSVKKSDEQKFLEGFEECLSETTRFLEKSKTPPGTLDKLTEHLKRFKENLDLPTSFSEAVPSHLLQLHPVSNGGGISSVLVEKEDTVKLLSHLEQPSTTTESSLDPSCPTTATFALNVPRLKREASLSPNLNNKDRIKRAPSSTTSSSTCLSPSFSNDSNNNNFANPEADGGGRFRQLSPQQSLTTNMIVLEQQQHGYPHPGSVESFDRQAVVERLRPPNHYAIPQLSSPVPNTCSNNDAYVLNLSTQNSSFASYCGGSRSPSVRVEPMQEDEPLDFSKPLNLSKNEVMDDQGRTWRPW